ncbi:uncharacterized protein N7477_003332 [Penicillium maclennaniae]|uniref:uncharacterized protein n=1 Tax=Penicillium maclennaniae TaxID=1343394 RepID=UPI00253FDD7C|nr:uncharacterized protein N7477_003332 [Penicillium maclennaniae]KAJ5677699.1 hypothetical protein N7477_003332 [Penicillium maclennaniae]
MTQTEGRRVDEQQRATSTAGKQGVRAPASIGFNSLTKAWVWLGANEVEGCNGRVDGIRDRDAAALKSHRAVPVVSAEAAGEVNEAATDLGGHHVRRTNEERYGYQSRVEGVWYGMKGLKAGLGCFKSAQDSLWVEGPEGKTGGGAKAEQPQKNPNPVQV